MAKLFAFENDTPTFKTPEPITTHEVSLEDQMYALEMAHASLEMANAQLDTVNVMKDRLMDTSTSLYVGMEHYAPIIDRMAANFGVRANLPSLEAYQDKYASTTAKNMALESIGGFFKAIWDRIVGFVKAIFNAFVGLIMGFKNKDAKSLARIEDICASIDQLIAKNAKISNTDKIISTLPGMLTDMGVSEFSTSDLLLQSSVRISAMKSIVGYINKNDYENTEKIKTTLTDNFNNFTNEYKKLQATHALYQQKEKQPGDYVAAVASLSDEIKEYAVRPVQIAPVSVDYFTDTFLTLVGEDALPPQTFAEIKQLPGYKSCSVKRLAVDTAFNSYVIFVVYVTTQASPETPSITESCLRVLSTPNNKAPTTLDPISTLGDLKKLAQEVKDLCRESVTVNAKKISEVYIKLVNDIAQVSVKFDKDATDIKAIHAALSKKASVSNDLLTEMVSGDTRSATDSGGDDTIKPMKDYLSRVDAANSKIRSTILSSSKELTSLVSFTNKVKTEATEAYLAYLNKVIAKYD